MAVPVLLYAAGASRLTHWTTISGGYGVHWRLDVMLGYVGQHYNPMPLCINVLLYKYRLRRIVAFKWHL